MRPGHLLLIGALLGVLALLVLGSRVALGTISSSPPAPSESISVSGSVTATAPDGGLRVTLGADTVPVSGTVGVSGTVPVTGTVSANVVGTVPVSGTVSTNVLGTVPVSGTVSTNVLGTVPVSGTVTASVTGNVIAFPPDGGTLVTLGTGVVPVTNILPDGGVGVFDVQGRGGGSLNVDEQGVVEVTGIAGARVDIQGPVTATISGTPAVTVSSGTVSLTGTVALSTASLATITAAAAERICTYAVGDPDDLSLTTTPANIPTSALTGRTALTIWNMETTREIWCNPAGGTASATAAVPVIDGTMIKFEGLNGTTLVSCRCATATCAYAYLEEKCFQPTP